MSFAFGHKMLASWLQREAEAVGVPVAEYLQRLLDVFHMASPGHPEFGSADAMLGWFLTEEGGGGLLLLHHAANIYAAMLLLQERSAPSRQPDKSDFIAQQRTVESLFQWTAADAAENALFRERIRRIARRPEHLGPFVAEAEDEMGLIAADQGLAEQIRRAAGEQGPLRSGAPETPPRLTETEWRRANAARARLIRKRNAVGLTLDEASLLNHLQAVAAAHTARVAPLPAKPLAEFRAEAEAEMALVSGASRTND